jgi:outer membrane protein OmpA-like peptidoglycan-associated protein
VTVDAIVKALNKRTRQFRPGESAAAYSREIEELKRIRKTRGWNLHDRERLANVTQGLGQIDLTVYFAFDSAEISPQAEPVLNTLGEALARSGRQGRLQAQQASQQPVAVHRRVPVEATEEHRVRDTRRHVPWPSRRTSAP